MALRFPGGARGGGVGGGITHPSQQLKHSHGHWATWGGTSPTRKAESPRISDAECTAHPSFLNHFLGLFCLKSGGKNKLLHIHKFKSEMISSSLGFLK